MYQVIIYDYEITKNFATMKEAIAYQEYIVFTLGLDAEIL